MSSDVFIIAAALDRDAPAAIRQAVELAGISPPLVQDVVFGLDDSGALADAGSLVRDAGLSSPSACVSTSVRAVFFAAASMLSDDAALSLVVGITPQSSTAFMLASPEAVGRLNLLPRARIAARSLTGAEPALRMAGLASSDIDVTKMGEQAASLLFELLEELDAKTARWGMVASGAALMIVERV